MIRIDTILNRFYIRITTMRIKLLLSLTLLALIQSSVYAQQTFVTHIADETITELLVYLLIIAVYALYWLKQKA